MPRRLLKKICPSPGSLQKRWYLRPFGDRIADPRLWTLHRRAVTSAFGVGLAICFIPLPVHLLVAGLIAICWRINLPAIYGTTLLVNPLTCVPVYYTAYRVGTTLLGISPESFNFTESAMILASVVLGGQGSQLGVALAAMALMLLQELTRDIVPAEYRMLLVGGAMVAIMRARPRGLLAYRSPSILLHGKAAR